MIMMMKSKFVLTDLVRDPPSKITADRIQPWTWQRVDVMTLYDIKTCCLLHNGFKNIRRRNGVKHDQRNDRSENLNKNLIRSLESGEKSDRKPYIPRNSCFP